MSEERPPAERARLLRAAARQRAAAGEHEAAAALYTESQAAAREAGDRRSEGLAGAGLAVELAWLDRPEQAHTALSQAAHQLSEAGGAADRIALALARQHTELLTLARAGALRRDQLEVVTRALRATAATRIRGVPAAESSEDVRQALQRALADLEALAPTLPTRLSRRALLLAAAALGLTGLVARRLLRDTPASPPAGDTPASPPAGDTSPTRSTPLREVSAGGHTAVAHGEPHALVVGINTYPTHPLTYARQDAEAVAALLAERYGFSVTALYDEQATLLAINRAIDALKIALEPGDSLLIFWAGHGVVEEGRSGRVGYLVPYDGSFDPGAFNAANLSMRHLSSLMTDLFVARHQLLIIDACYGGLATRGAAEADPIDPEALRTLLGRSAVQIITAGSGDQEVLDVGADGHSLFTARLLAALREAEGYLTAGELFGRLEGEVTVAAQALGHQQKPEYTRLEGDGSFVFLPITD